MKKTIKRTLGLARRGLAVMVALSMVLSVLVICNVSVSAETDITVYFKNTSNWSPMYAYAWNTGNTSIQPLRAWPGTLMERVGTSVYYKITVPTSADRIIFSGGDDSHKTADLTLFSTDKRLYDNGTGLWSNDFDESKYTSNNNVTNGGYDAVTNHNFPSGIFAANATYFDYMSDAELDNGYNNPVQAGTSFNGSADNWYPFYEFNRVIARNVVDKDNGWTYPLYFGNFCNTGGAYDTSAHNGPYTGAIHGNNVSRFHYFANNSNTEGDYNHLANNRQAVQGLAYNKLDDAGNIYVTPNTKMPYFDIDFLSKKFTNLKNNPYESANGQRIAQIYKSYFPFREETNSNTKVTTYTFDSTDAKDNIYFTWGADNKPKTVNYGAGTSYGVRDGIQYFMNPDEYSHEHGKFYRDVKTYGIFPFNGGVLDVEGISKDEILIQQESNLNIWAWSTGEGKKLTRSTKTIEGKNYYSYTGIGSATKCIIFDGDGITEYNKKSGELDINAVKGAVVNKEGKKVGCGNGNLNYGFGIRIDIDFRVPKNGKINGDDVKFEYSGDDDLWIYLSDENGENSELILDLGGNHKMAKGDINFATMQVTANDVYDSASKTSKGRVVEYFNGSSNGNIKHLDPNETYHMTVFYMERGLIESNFQFKFTFAPLDNLLTTEKVVDTADVNAGIRSAVANAETFTVTNKASSTATGSYSALGNKTYSYSNNGVNETYTTSENGSYKILQHNGKASFTNITDTGKYLEITEKNDGTSRFTYDTAYTVTDVENNKIAKDAVNSAELNNVSGNTAKFKFENSVDKDELTHYNVKFINKPKTGSVTAEKSVEDSDGKEVTTDTTDFGFTLKLDVDGKGYKTYPNVEYTKKTSFGNVSGKTDANGKFTLKHGESVVFEGIPLGVDYVIAEDLNDNYVTPGDVTGSVSQDTPNPTVTFVNTPINRESAYITINAYKKLDGLDVDIQDNFSFVLQQMKLKDGKLVDDESADAVHREVGNTGNGITFPKIEYKYVSSGQETTVKPTVAPVTTQPTTAPVTTQPTTVPPTVPKNTKTITVGVISYIHNETNPSSYKVHYWGGSGGAKDADCISLGTTESRSVGAGYWNNAPQTFHMYTAEIPKDATGFKFHIGDRWFGDDGNAASDNSVYIFNYSGDKALYVKAGDADPCNSIYSVYSEPSEYTASAGSYLAVRSNTEVYYYKLYEKNQGNADYKYDSKVYYVVVTVTTTATGVTAEAKYYGSEADAIAQRNEIGTDDDYSNIVFNNYHNGAITVNKQDANGNSIADGVKFKLYKVEAENASIESAPMLDPDGAVISDTANYEGESITEGSITFDNLDIFKNQSSNPATLEEQWYCLVESQAKDGFMLSSTKHYFMLPDKDGNYRTTQGVINYPVKMPNSSGSGVKGFVVTGMGFILASALLGGAYVLYDKKERKKHIPKHGRR